MPQDYERMLAYLIGHYQVYFAAFIHYRNSTDPDDHADKIKNYQDLRDTQKLINQVHELIARN